MATIQNLPENRFNFLRFYPEITPQIASSQYSEGLHNGYLYRWRKQKDFLPVLVNDTLTFYTNFATDLIGANNVRILEGDTIINDITKYDLTVTPFGAENSKIELTIPPTNTSNNKVFNIGIVGSTGTTTLEENTKIAGTSLIGGNVYKVLKLSTGNFIMVGDFTQAGAMSENVIVIDPAGNKVNTYSFGWGFNGAVYDVAEQADGKLIFVGDFEQYNGTPINRIIRTSATGVYDATFNVGTGATSVVKNVEIDSSGNVYIGSNISFIYNGSGSAQRVFKLSSVGVRDVAYVINSVHNDLKIQPDGKLLLGRDGVSGVTRLNTDGTIDGTFTSGLSPFAQVNTVELDSSGNIYVGGVDLVTASSQKIAKLGSTGTLDTGFSTTITNEILNIRREGTSLYVSGYQIANIISLTGTNIEVLPITTGQMTGFVYLSPTFYLLISNPSTFSYDGGTSTSITLIETITTFPILYRSNCFILKQRTEANINNTHLISFYNNSSVYNYEWSVYDVNIDTPYTVRIPSSIKELSYGKDQSVYTSATTGTSRVTRATTSKNYQFETYYNNEDFHDAFSIASSFKYFSVNTKEYICEEYSIEYQQNMNIFKGIANLRDVEYGRRVNTCTNLT